MEAAQQDAHFYEHSSESLPACGQQPCTWPIDKWGRLPLLSGHFGCNSPKGGAEQITDRVACRLQSSSAATVFVGGLKKAITN